MRVIIQTLIISSILLMSSVSNGQTVSNDNGIKDFVPKTIKRSFTNISDPIGDWPGCAEPKALKISPLRDDLLISWDANLKISDKYFYEVVVLNSDTKATIKSSIISQNNYVLEKSYSRSNNNIEVKVRRVCRDNNNNIVYSIWVKEKYTPAVPCTGGVISKEGGFCSDNPVSPIISISVDSTTTVEWEKQVGSGSWVVIQGASSYSYAPGIISTTTSYRRKASCGSYSNVVTYEPNPIVTKEIMPIIADVCSGNTINLSLDIQYPSVTYQWENSATTSSINVIPNTTRSYWAIARTPYACITIYPRTVTVNQAPNVTITGINTICQGNSTTLSVPSGMTYLWNNSQTTNAITVSPNVSTNYTVTVTNSAGCSSVKSLMVNVNLRPNAAITGLNNICIGQSTILSASGANSYNWNNGSTSSSLTVSPSSITSYTVTVTNTNSGCSAATSHQVIPVSCQSNCSLSISGDSTICTGLSTSLVASVSGNNCINPSFVWSNGSTTQSIVVSPQSSATYTVSVTFSNSSLQLISSKVVNVGTTPSVVIVGNENVCSGQSTILVASGGLNYSWSNGGAYDSILVFPIATTTYTVTVTNSSGCTNSAQKTVFVDCAQSCSIAFANISISNCSNNLYSVSGILEVSNGSEGIVSVSSGGTSLDINISNGNNNYPFTLINLPADGLTHAINGLAVLCDTTTVTHNAPNSCQQGGTASYTLTNCDPQTNTFSLNISINVINPVSGSQIEITESGVNSKIITVGTNSNYVLSFDNIVANGDPGYIMIDAPWGTDSIPYIKLAQCTPNVCNVSNISVTPTACDKVSQKYQLNGVFNIEYPVNYHDFTVSILELNLSQTITNTGASSYNFNFNNLNPNGSTLTVSVSHGSICGNKSVTFKSPSSCVDLPEYKCGVNNTHQNSGNTTRLDTAYAGSVFYINGIAFEADTIDMFQGTFTGVGAMPIPFSKNKLKVRFNGITINTSHEVLSGSVVGVRAVPSENFNIPQNPINIGGEICVKEPVDEVADSNGHDNVTGLNDRGFKKDSLYYPGGTKYDPNGYDYSGINKDTGTPYDRFGCDVESLDINKMPCSRDSVLITKQDTLTTIIETKIDLILLNANDEIIEKLQSFKCDSLKNRVSALIEVAGLESQSQFIIGSNQEYINNRMSKFFDSEPKTLINNSNRDPDVIELEKTHVELYKCDLFKEKFERALEELNGIDRDKFLAFLFKKIKGLSSNDIDHLMTDENILLDWVLARLVEFAASPQGVGYIDPVSIPLRSNIMTEDRSSAYFSTASIDNFNFDFTPGKGEEEKWLFQQGFKEIKGVDRALYLEELYKQMQVTEKMLGGNANNHLLMPIALIKDDVEGKAYKIFLDNIEITPTTATLDAFFVYQDPRSTNGQKIVMKAENLSWGTGGMIGETKLQLKTGINLRLNNAAMLKLSPTPASGQGGCFVSWDCSGFKGIGLEGQVEICREFIVPLDPVTLLPEAGNENYSFSFAIEIKGWHDLYIELNKGGAGYKPFAVTGYEDIKWNLKGITVDNSDIRSPNGLQLVEGYTSPHLEGGGLGKTWRGIVINELSATLPSIFSKNGENTTVGVENVVIDDTGFNGTVFGAPLIPYEEGNLSGWQFSLDTFKLNFVKNHIQGGGMAGKLRVPVFKNPSRYSGTYNKGGNLSLSITLAKNQEMDLFLADATLDSTSTITVEINGNDAKLTATLNGSLEVKGGGSSGALSKISIPKLNFTNFKVANYSPYFDAGQWKLTDTVKASIGGFEINLSGIGAVKDPGNVETAGLSFNLGLSLPLNIKADGSFEIMGKMMRDNLNRQSWVFRSLDVNGIFIDAKIGAGHLKGGIALFDEKSGPNAYGTGFHGLIDMDFTGLVKVKAVALFAKKQDKKFFYIDASAELGSGIPIGPLAITGFTGGASYRMRQEVSDKAPKSNGVSRLPVPGVSLSGNIYRFDPDQGLHLRAGVLMALSTSKKAFNGSLEFGIEFNNPETTGGGVGAISLDGKGQFMSDLPITGPRIQTDIVSKPTGVSANISAHVRFKYNFNSSEFSGNIGFFVAAPGLEGEGNVDILINRDKWYMYMGTPQKGIYLKYKIGNLAQINAESYLDIGSVVPDMKPLPDNVRAVAYKVKQSSLRASGAGFVFGTRLNVSLEVDAVVAKASLYAEVGFDLMVRDFGQATCGGSGDQIGINGWYAMGQMYAYVEGELKVYGVNIFSAAIAAVLQAELPNPFFAQATLGVRVKTFLRTFNKSVALVLGKRCEIQADSTVNALGMKLISTINPNDQSKNLETDFKPIVNFNFPINRVVEMGEDKWRGRISKCSITSLKTNKTYKLDTLLSLDGTNLKIKPTKLFNGGDSLLLEISVEVTKNGLNPIVETETRIFTVGSAYKYIPQANIMASYPIDGMKNYYRKEYKESTGYNGFIQLVQGMPELFYDVPQGSKQQIKLTNLDNNTSNYLDFSYDGISARLNYELNPDLFNIKSNYVLEIVQVDESVSTTASHGGTNYTTQAGSINLGSAIGGPQGNLPDEDTEESMSGTGEISLCTIQFRVSMYDKFVDKVASGVNYYLNNNIENKYVKFENEAFDNLEIENQLVSVFPIGGDNSVIKLMREGLFQDFNLQTCGCAYSTNRNAAYDFNGLLNNNGFIMLGNSYHLYSGIKSSAEIYMNNIRNSINKCNDPNVDNFGCLENLMIADSILLYTLSKQPIPLNVSYNIPLVGRTSERIINF